MEMEKLKNLIYQVKNVDIECKEAGAGIPESVYESYSAMANTKGGYIILGVKKDKTKSKPEERFFMQGIDHPETQKEDFWNTMNSNMVSVNILKEEDVCIVEEDGISLMVIHVPRADFNMRPVYVGGNPYRGTYKRNNERDYRATEYEIKGMIRDKNPEGNDGMILEYYTMDDIDKETFKRYRQVFEIRNDGHVWNLLTDKNFLEKLGGYRRDRRTGIEGLTLAGLMMFGTSEAVRECFSNVFMDYRNKKEEYADVCEDDRITYDGTWENNLFNFFTKVTQKITGDLKQTFQVEGMQLINETLVYKAVYESIVNLIIHADYLIDAGVLKIIKKNKEFEFTNPGILKMPIKDVYEGGNSKSRNSHIQIMFRMIGFGNSIGSGFPMILNAWQQEGWIKPELVENTNLNQVTLVLKMNEETGVKTHKSFIHDNDRRLNEVLGEVLTEANLKKVLPLIPVLEEKGEVRPKEAEDILGKSTSTTYRYLNILVDAGILVTEGNTNNIVYKLRQND